VIADNCTDDTAVRARAAGATVLERQSDTHRGKHHAIEWAFEQLPWQQYEAVIVIDADTVVEPDYSSQLSRWPDLEKRALQTYDHLSNEQENSLTRLAGLLTRTRYDTALPLKARAGLSVPMTGDGIVLGRDILTRYPWHIRTITEGWELYARLTIGGEVVGYEPRARLYAQETRSLDQSRSQRERWTAGRLGVFRIYWRTIVFGGGLGALQRLDLVAELTSLGPVVRATTALIGFVATYWCVAGGRTVLAVLFLTGLLQPALYSCLSLIRHPYPWATVKALGYLPFYAGWRLVVAAGTLKGLGSKRWVRTQRRDEHDSPLSRSP
jgi:cellulose synthase/poly-beta-1,6-N-acetylglucosamine synthase-like glycosyltransferase